MRLSLDVADTEVAVTAVFAGVDHTGAGSTLPEALHELGAGLRYLADRWSTFAPRTGRAAPDEVARADLFMEAVRATDTAQEVVALLAAAFALPALPGWPLPVASNPVAG